MSSLAVSFSPILTDSNLQDSTICLQEQQLGSGHALASALVAFEPYTPPNIGDRKLYRGSRLRCQHLLVCPTDIPALPADTVRTFVNTNTSPAILAMRLADPHGYGRLVTKNNMLQKIVEERDANNQTRHINLCNSGVLLLPLAATPRLLSQLQRDNAQGEFYLTDIFNNLPTHVHIAANPIYLQGVNNQQQLAAVTKLLHTEHDY